jgi:hypothetical protein
MVDFPKTKKATGRNNVVRIGLKVTRYALLLAALNVSLNSATVPGSTSASPRHTVKFRWAGGKSVVLIKLRKIAKNTK